MASEINAGHYTEMGNNHYSVPHGPLGQPPAEIRPSPEVCIEPNPQVLGAQRQGDAAGRGVKEMGSAELASLAHRTDGAPLERGVRPPELHPATPTHAAIDQKGGQNGLRGIGTERRGDVRPSPEARVEPNPQVLGPQRQGDAAGRGVKEMGSAELASLAHRTDGISLEREVRPSELHPAAPTPVGMDQKSGQNGDGGNPSISHGGRGRALDSPKNPASSGENIPKNDTLNTGGPEITAEQSIINRLGQETGETVILYATEGRADLNTVAALFEKEINPDMVVDWISNHVDLQAVATLLDKGVDEGRVTTWLSRDVNLGELATYMGRDVSRESALQLVRAGMDSSTALPLLQEGVDPQTILGLLKTGVSHQDVSDTIKQNVATLMKDGKTSFRLTEPNAIQALNGPDGTYARVSGPDVPGADIRFLNPQTGDVVLVRELKSVSSTNGFDTQARSLPAQLANEGGVKEAKFQVPYGTNAESWVAGFREHRQTANLAPYKRIYITINDPGGTQLWHGYLG